MQRAKGIVHWGSFGQHGLIYPTGAGIIQRLGEICGDHGIEILQLIKPKTRPVIHCQLLRDTALCRICGRHIIAY